MNQLSTWGIPFHIEDTLTVEDPATFPDTPADAAPLEDPDIVPKFEGTLRDLILHFGCSEGGTTRAYIKAQAERSGFNVGSVSPTLVKLGAEKLIKRIGTGVYATTLAGKSKLPVGK